MQSPTGFNKGRVFCCAILRRFLSSVERASPYYFAAVISTSLSISGVGLDGDILAPKAAFSFPNGQINGNLVVNTRSGTYIVNNYLFGGCMPSR